MRTGKAAAVDLCLHLVHLRRRFRSVTDRAPSQWLLAQRLPRAQELLGVTSLSIDAVAQATGTGTGTTLRRQLKRAVGVPPDTYRRAFHDTPPARHEVS